jgi:cyclase
MRRSICLGIIAVVGMFVTMTTYEGRQERTSLAVHDLGNNLYMLANAPGVQGMGGGGNTAIFVTDDGVVLVDTKIKGYGQDILGHVREITDKPVTTIINTHTHWDHSGANTEFPDTVEFVVHENTRGHLASNKCDDGQGFEGGSIKNCGAFQGANAKYLPKTTFSDTMTLFSGADQINLHYFGRGHTDGDTFVVFPAARAMHTGDLFQGFGLPFVDVANTNGSRIEFGPTLKKAMAGISDVDTVITGHTSRPLTWNDFVNYTGFYNDVLMQAREGKVAGRTVDDIVGSYNVPSQYSDFSAPENRLRSTVQYVFDGQ